MTELVDLPRPLQPWQDWLGWFEPALALQVGEMVRRLADLVGVAPAAGRAGAPEPDGLGDLRSRGPYERLLASEWLLAEELPDEFLRRAAASEHLFLAPRLRARQVERSVVAIFDAGPRALGAPRLAHIAAWILLARRAADGGGSLRWGVLQAPSALHPGDASTQLAALMRARRFDAGPADPAGAWRALLAGDATQAACEIWWIGAAPPAGELPRNERTLTLQATFDGDALEAALGSPAGLRRTSLPLPPASTATALLRGEFRTAAAAPRVPTSRIATPARLSLTQTLLMSMPPGQVAVPELGQPSMMVFTVPRSRHGKQARPRRQQWSATRTPIAATLSHGETLAIGSEGTTLHFWQMPGFEPRERPGRDQFEASASTANWMAMIRLQSNKGRRACVIDRAGRLVSWAGNPPRQAMSKTAPADLPIDVVDQQVAAMVQLGTDSLAYAMAYGNGLWLRQLGAAGGPSTLTRRLCRLDSAAVDVHFTLRGYGTARPQVASVAVAPRHDAATWQIMTITAIDQPIDHVDGASTTELAILPGERVFGLTNQRGTHPPALVILCADRRRLRLATTGSSTTLHQGDSIIERCSVCPASGLVAVLTRDRTLRVFDPSDREPLLVVTDSVAATHAHQHHPTYDDA